MNTNRLLIVLLILVALLSPERAMAGSRTSSILALVPVSSAWTGGTIFSQPMSFNVVSNGTQWNTFKLKAFFIADTCDDTLVTLEVTVSGPGSIANSQFSISSSNGFSVDGQFIASTVASGVFSFVNFPVNLGACTYFLNQSGTWSAEAAGVSSHKVTLQSFSGFDGWILESAETSSQGGTINAFTPTFNLGDHASNKQYRAVLDFCLPSNMPFNTIITKAVLRIKRQGLVGTDPFTTHNKIAVDIRQGAFSNNFVLQLADFQAAASKSAVGLIPNNPQPGNWYSVNLNATALPFISPIGCTQLRLRFQTDDNNDLGADFLKFYSGDAAEAFRPKLIITFEFQ